MSTAFKISLKDLMTYFPRIRPTDEEVLDNPESKQRQDKLSSFVFLCSCLAPEAGIEPATDGFGDHLGPSPSGRTLTDLTNNKLNRTLCDTTSLIMTNHVILVGVVEKLNLYWLSP